MKVEVENDYKMSRRVHLLPNGGKTRCKQLNCSESHPYRR